MKVWFGWCYVDQLAVPVASPAGVNDAGISLPGTAGLYYCSAPPTSQSPLLAGVVGANLSASLTPLPAILNTPALLTPSDKIIGNYSIL